MEIFYTYRAIADLRSLPKADQKRIASKMGFYADVDNSIKFAEKLVDSKLGQFRFRIGNFRVVFDVSDNRIFVLKIARRDKVYK